MAYIFPKFEDLPPVTDAPPGCLWGFYDRDGQKDEIGSINLLTPQVVKEASGEIQTGRHVQLDWPLNSLKFPTWGRKILDHRLLDMSQTEQKSYAFDDEISINTQACSQWDSLRHVKSLTSQLSDLRSQVLMMYAKRKWSASEQHLFYNGLTYDEARVSKKRGIHNFCDRGGIVGRGVLIDMVRYWAKIGQPAPDPWGSYEITVSELEAALSDQHGTQTRQGDILLVRTGYIQRHNAATDAERQEGTQANFRSIGLAPRESMLRWLYDRHFAAVVADNVAVEALPSPPDSECSSLLLHDWLLVWWGTPLGELWDLEGLGKVCSELGRWTFFLTSAPLNVTGGAASPPGAIAIF
ncbi:hypothetical protein PG996_011569 [Apiospora saccharicola]|uniref:Cyclase n=1 Tax=Apiospora saccharicola TaxID=335842 RepID=A0ABR1UFE3_9PEZI